MVAGFVKSFNLPIQYVLYDISYANITLYTSSLPSYEPKDEKSSEEDHSTKTMDSLSSEEQLKIISSL